ncbi:hypothetical protein PGT21_009090 [Puccinia graminis f. sp. tritici]|uniref:Uncharacterized protein n=1 Tax=Puccinia graminis f. sp. tritici TaxID=56615 RepID=A0A5B0QFE9_PUCGR|nr:hypothetical protein PGT21_009090 [Puccinia graminis f. sp. tritici]
MANNKSFLWLLWFMVSIMANLADTALINKLVLPKQKIAPRQNISLGVVVEGTTYNLVAIKPCQCESSPGNHWSIMNEFSKTIVCVVKNSQNTEILRDSIPSHTNAHINVNSNEVLNVEFYSVLEEN